MDGTLSWEPFVEQTIAMVRSVHKHRYRMGVGYKVKKDGTTIKNYWERIEEEGGEAVKLMKPYRIELVGVVCDAYLAVVRGIRRAIAIGRAVRVKSQLKSHKRFARWKDGDNKLLSDPDEIKCLAAISSLNDEAVSLYELYTPPNLIYEPGSVWKDIVLSPTRASIQLELRAAIENFEKKNGQH
ncbi:hypothetical protein RJ639_013529 [Escallonia herrerae]|uniref:Uncharacterized protein n=1 Tax=Escallonia herrerae TaxID=1293975 RepID=A0AA88VKP4_9ASTE|nr:hypothetical protein RJ639_013529 [Escallonia herrerae]